MQLFMNLCFLQPMDSVFSFKSLRNPSNSFTLGWLTLMLQVSCNRHQHPCHKSNSPVVAFAIPMLSTCLEAQGSRASDQSLQSLSSLKAFKDLDILILLLFFQEYFVSKQLISFGLSAVTIKSTENHKIHPSPQQLRLSRAC